MPDLLLEVGCEELPSSACRELIDQVPGLARTALADLRLPEAETAVWVSPRRMALVLRDLPKERPGRTASVRGPAVEAAYGEDGAPTRAAQGFARSQGVAVEDLVAREDGSRRFVFAERVEPAEPLAALVPELARRVIDGIRFGKTMRWGDGRGLRFSRPVRWLVAKVDSATVRFVLHGLEAGDRSQGHRFLGGPVQVGSPASYRDDLRAAAVTADHEERRAAIVSALDAAAAAAGGRWSDPGGVLQEVVFLVEHPSVITGQIDSAHLRLPRRVLITAMQGHQRYFPLEGDDRELRGAFLAVSNGDPAHAELITRGHEGVLDARLQDAAFSFDKDRAAGLEALDARLDRIVFHARLGTMADKRERLVEAVAEIAEAVGMEPHERGWAVDAARLAKADQGAVLVAEFSELEGDVAAEYARIEGWPEEVCRAIAEQYLPLGPDSPLPRDAAGAALAAAEKLDNLAGAFLVDEAPTGSKDPYGLRRAAAGLVRVLLAQGWDLPLRPLLEGAARRLRAQGADLVGSDDEAIEEIEDFVADRLAHHLAEEGVAPETTRAAAGADLGSVVATAAWARGLHRARGGGPLRDAATAATRVVRIAAKGPEQPGPFRSVGDPGEDALAAALERARPAIDGGREERRFESALAAAAGLAEPVDRFFEEVLVNADDPDARTRRYALVGEAAALLGRVADFTQIPTEAA